MPGLLAWPQLLSVQSIMGTPRAQAGRHGCTGEGCPVVNGRGAGQQGGILNGLEAESFGGGPVAQIHESLARL